MFSFNLSGADDNLKFADFLYSKAQYYRAITEYERYIFLNPLAKNKDEIAYKIGLCYFDGQQYEEAIKYYYDYLEDYDTSPFTVSSLNKIVEAYFILQNYDHALFELNNYYQAVDKDKLKLQAKAFIGKIYFYEYDWDKAFQTWDECEKEFAVDLKKDKDYTKQAQNLSHRSPVLAGFFSIIFPGLGQVYNGDYGDAFAVLIVNGVFGYLIYDALKYKNYVETGIFGFLEIGWYSGTVYGAVRGAQKYNLRQKEDFVKSIDINFKF